MNLYNLLVHLPNEQLKRLAQEFGVSAISPSQRSLTDSIAARYKENGFIALLIDELSDDCRDVLKAFVFFTSPHQDSIPIPESFRLMRFQDAESFDNHLSLLFAMGLLFRDSGEAPNRVILPQELRTILQNQLLAPWKELIASREIPLDSVHAAQDGVEAVFHLLGLLQHHRAQLTQKGSIHRKIIERWRSRFNGDGPDEEFFQFIFNFCLDRELLTIHHGCYRPSPRVTEWLSKPLAGLRDDVWHYFLKKIALKDPEFRYFLTVLYIFQTRILTEKVSPVYPIGSIGELIKSCPASSLKNHRIAHFLHWLENIGIVRIERIRGLYEDEKPGAFAITETGAEVLFQKPVSRLEESQSYSAVLQPNFELLVPSTTDYLTLWKLEQIAEFRRRDVMSEYHLSQRSMIYAMRRGWTTDSLLTFIGNLISGTIPDNVRFTLEAWCGKYGQITMRRTVLLECASAELADEILHVPGVGPMIEKRIADRFFTILESNAKPLMRLLQNRGYEPAAKRLAGEE